MAMTGFDPSVVNGSMTKVEDAYSKLMAALKTRMQGNFVEPMSNYWACNAAINFFSNNLKPSVDDLLKASFQTFQSVIMSMNSAANSWAQQTKSSWTARTFKGTLQNIDVSSIKENISGVRGVDETEANNTADVLATIASDAESALTLAQSAVSSCGFVGRGQAEALISSLGIIKNNINSATTELTGAVKSAINSTVSDYGDLGTKVETAFTAE